MTLKYQRVAADPEDVLADSYIVRRNPSCIPKVVAAVAISVVVVAAAIAVVMTLHSNNGNGGRGSGGGSSGGNGNGSQPSVYNPDWHCTPARQNAPDCTKYSEDNACFTVSTCAYGQTNRTRIAAFAAGTFSLHS